MVLTLGTGFGTALFDQGRLCPHLELAHHPFRSGDTYEDQLGDKARKRLGSRHWTRRVRLAVDLLREIVHFDRLYVGGGNARRLDGDLGEDVEVVPNEAGLLGGIRLWDEARPPGA